MPYAAWLSVRETAEVLRPGDILEANDGELSNTIYNHLGFVYGDRYLGFLTYFTRDLKNPTLTVRLVTSRDGDHWRRPETGQPLIGVGSIGDVDRFTNMLTGAPPIRWGDRLYIYYRALANRHKPYEGSDSGLKGGGICLATLRVDGFASVGAGYDGGQLTTRPFLFEGTKLQINAKADYGQVTQLTDEELARKQRDLFRILPHTNEVETKICFITLLIEVEHHQGPAN